MQCFSLSRRLSATHDPLARAGWPGPLKAASVSLKPGILPGCPARMSGSCVAGLSNTTDCRRRWNKCGLSHCLECTSSFNTVLFQCLTYTLTMFPQGLSKRRRQIRLAVADSCGQKKLRGPHARWTQWTSGNRCDLRNDVATTRWPIYKWRRRIVFTAWNRTSSKSHCWTFRYISTIQDKRMVTTDRP